MVVPNNMAINYPRYSVVRITLDVAEYRNDERIFSELTVTVFECELTKSVYKKTYPYSKQDLLYADMNEITRHYLLRSDLVNSDLSDKIAEIMKEQINVWGIEK